VSRPGNGWLAALVSVGLFVVAQGHAEPTPRTLTFRYSPYEREAIASAEAALGGAIEPTPEGKLIESLEFVRLPPIESRDPLPGLLNAAHVRTQPFVIRRQLVTREGDRYRKVLVDESARNLRTLPQLSLVVCVAFRGSADDRVRLVVITKDVWSLFFDVDLKGSGGGLSNFMIAPQESNLLGLHHKLALELNVDPITYSVGARYEIPRVYGSAVNWIADANAVVDHQDGQGMAGSFGKVQAVQPLLTNRSEWAWFSSVAWNDRETREFNGAQRSTFSTGAGGASDELITKEWHTTQGTWLAAVTRSFGWKTKNDLTLFFSAGRSDYRLPGTDHESSILSVVEEFERKVLPTSNTVVGPGLEYHAYTSDFLRTYELETLGLQEDYRLGHNLLFGLAPTRQTEAYSYDALPDQAHYEALQIRAYTVLQETLPLKDGFIRAALEGATSLTLSSKVSGPQSANADLRERMAFSTLRNSSVIGRLRVASPRLGFGRLVDDTVVTLRFFDSLNTTQQYGDGSRLRGYASGLQGQTTAVTNLEYRTPAVQLTSEQIGAALFYDAAAVDTAADFDWHAFQARSSVGAGLRVVTPLLERSGIRFDIAFPVNRCPVPGSSAPKAVDISLAFGQAFGVPDVTPIGPP
jgi:hypothetical protein